MVAGMEFGMYRILALRSSCAIWGPCDGRVSGRVYAWTSACMCTCIHEVGPASVSDYGQERYAVRYWCGIANTIMVSLREPLRDCHLVLDSAVRHTVQCVPRHAD